MNSKTSQLFYQDKFALCTDGQFCDWSVVLTVTNQRQGFRSDVAGTVGHRPPLAPPNIVVRDQRESVSRDWALCPSEGVECFCSTCLFGPEPSNSSRTVSVRLHEFLFIHPPSSTLSWCFTSAQRASDSLDYILDHKRTSPHLHTSEIHEGKMLWKLADNVKYEDDCEVRGRSEPKRAFRLQSCFYWRIKHAYCLFIILNMHIRHFYFYFLKLHAN